MTPPAAPSVIREGSDTVYNDSKRYGASERVVIQFTMAANVIGRETFCETITRECYMEIRHCVVMGRSSTQLTAYPNGN